MCSATATAIPLATGAKECQGPASHPDVQEEVSAGATPLNVLCLPERTQMAQSRAYTLGLKGQNCLTSL